jgi:hypothetical protein
MLLTTTKILDPVFPSHFPRLLDPVSLMPKSLSFLGFMLSLFSCFFIFSHTVLFDPQKNFHDKVDFKYKLGEDGISEDGKDRTTYEDISESTTALLRLLNEQVACAW